ncbi:hypothetical protein EZV62_005325 [Acer yangbiense]|uniref:Calcium-transporting ATPase n=1 Tax=Acer yangbiense TaxID=1000413 RepID=A0A5C7IMG4_9ROSI|nr:hypothetical protein EZV62_005325 [Acer yangbiense]
MNFEKFLKEFDVEPKNPSEAAIRRWRSAVSIVKNRRRRFRMTADLDKRSEAEQKKLKIQVSILSVFFEYSKYLEFLEKIRVALYVQKAALQFIDAGARGEYTLSDEAREAGFSIPADELASIVRGHDIKGLKFHGGVEGISRKVSVSLHEGVHESDIPIRQKIFGINRYTEKPPRIFLMFVWDALQDLTLIMLMVCAVLSIGVGLPTEGWPAGMYDGLGILLSIILVVMSGVDETPLQVKLNGVATIIGKIGLSFAVVTFLVLAIRFLVEKAIRHEITHWTSADALTLIDYFAIAVTIIVVAVPEGLPLAVTLSLAFAMKKLMNDRALVRHLSACETMGSASCICTDKTGTLTTNHMVVSKIWICTKITDVKTKEDGSIFQLEITERALNILLQAIFQNTGSEVVKDKEGKNTILGTPTEIALLELGLLLGGDFKAQRKEFKIIKVEPFNSVRKKMSVLVALPEGSGLRAFCKGASEIVLEMCDKLIDDHGETVPLSEEKFQEVTDIINGFASEALRTLCLVFKDLNGSSYENNIPDNGYTLIAVVGIKDPVRPGVKEAVQTCLAAGITVRMVTGDNINTAKAIARECGILTPDGEAVEGPEFRNMSPDEMKRIIPKLQVMARSMPLDKHTLVTQLKNTFGEVVAVTGDGTNDAPALKESDIGLAMGIAGTEVFNEINSREMEKINIFRGMFDSWLFMGVMVGTVVFQVIIVEFLGNLASTVPLSWQLWLFCVLIGAVSMPIAVVIKFIPVGKGTTAKPKHHDGYEALPSGPELA